MRATPEGMIVMTSDLHQLREGKFGHPMVFTPKWGCVLWDFSGNNKQKIVQLVCPFTFAAQSRALTFIRMRLRHQCMASTVFYHAI